MPDREQAMLDYGEKIATSASTIVQEDVARLREVGWTDREVLDIALVASYYNFRCRMADSLGVELDEGRVDSELLQELTSRRVIADRP